MQGSGDKAADGLTCLRNRGQESEVLQDSAFPNEDEVQTPVIQVAVGEEPQRAPVASAGRHNCHDALELPLQQ